MSTKLLTLLLASSLLLPLSAQDKGAFDVTTDGETTAEGATAEKTVPKKLAPKVAARLKKAEAAAKKLEKTKALRAEKKVKWETNEKKAFKEAEKYNLPVWVLYTDPATCGICVKLDNEVLDTKEFKNAKGVFIGFRSSKPLPQYECAAGKPMGVIMSPDKKRMNPGKYFSYVPGMGPEQYLNMLRNYADRLQKEEEQKVNAELDAARAEAGVAE